MNNMKARTWIGAALIILGGLFIIDNFNLLNFDLTNFIFSWEVIVIVIGAVLMINDRGNFVGLVMIVIGLLFLFSDIYYYDVYEIFYQYWPILLIILGLSILLKRHDSAKKGHVKNWDKKKSIVDDDELDEASIFAATKKMITSKNFKGGRVTAIFGGSEIDLLDAELAEGENVIDVIAIFGGVELIIPPHMKVMPKLSSVFGGFDDKRRRVEESEINSDKVLVIKGLAVFGGGEIKN